MRVSILWYLVGCFIIIGGTITSNTFFGVMGLLCFILAELEEIKEKLEAEKK